MTARARQRGFSMTELLVVVTVILILVSLLFVVGGRMYGQSRLLQCQHYLEQIGRAMNMYATGHQGTLPAPRSLGGRLWFETLAATHLDDGRILGCPLVGPPPHIRLTEVPVVSEEPLQRFDKALYWLRDHQIKDGANAGQFPMVGAALSRKHDNVNTGFALMAYLGAGCNDRYPPEFADTVRMAVEYLTGTAFLENPPENEGPFSGGMGWRAAQSHLTASTGVPLMALAAAYQSLEDPVLRSRARMAAESALQWLADIMPHNAALNYHGPSPEGERGRMSVSSWVFQGVGMSQKAGFHVPSNIRSAMQFFLQQNAASDGRIGKQWDPDGAGTDGYWRMWTKYGFSLTVRLSLGDSPGSPTVQHQIADITTPLASGIPRHMSEFSDGRRRWHWYHASRGLRLYGGQEWEEFLNPSPQYGWQGLPHYVGMYMIDDGYDDEGYPMGYWPDNIGLAAYEGYQKYAYVTAFSAMMFSDVFDESWLDEEFIPPADRETSYGYNSALGKSRAAVPASTIMIMDYDNWLIQRGTGDPEEDDDDSRIALRHLGRANVLMGDGSVRSLYLEEITPRGRWTLERGD